MNSWSLAEVLAATGGTPAEGLKATLPLGSICTDTREIEAGDLFVPLVGERFDGHDYLETAFQKGAAAALSQGPAHPRAVRVDDTLTAYQNLGRYYRQRLDVPVVAVTGSTGKTTTKELIAALLGTRFKVHRTHANFNNDVGVPKTLLGLTADHQVAVLELAMRAAGEIRRLARLLAAEVGVITNIGESHIEFLGSREAIADAKGELFEELPATSVAVVPADSPFFERLRGKVGCRLRTFSALGEAEFAPEKVENLGVRGWEFSFQGSRFRFGYPGRHHLEDLMAALAATADFGLGPHEIASALEGFQPTGMRLRIEQRGDILLINDAYNAAPASVVGALEVLGQAQGRKIAVLGDMLELGCEEKAGHRRTGEACAAHQVDVLLAIGSRSRTTAEAARAGGVPEVHHLEQVEKAEGLLRDILKPGDTLLLKASRGMALERLVSILEVTVES